MIIVYSRVSCTSSRGVRSWFKSYQLPYQEISLNQETITKHHFYGILQLTHNGVEELLSTGGRTYAKLSKTVNFDELKLTELFRLIQLYPKLLKTPIIFDDQRLLVGFNEQEIRQFLPRTYRCASLEINQSRKTKPFPKS